MKNIPQFVLINRSASRESKYFMLKSNGEKFDSQLTDLTPSSSRMTDVWRIFPSSWERAKKSKNIFSKLHKKVTVRDNKSDVTPFGAVGGRSP